MTTTLDTSLFFLVNRSMTNPFFDILMPLLSERGFLLALPVLLLAAVSALRLPASTGGPSLRLALIVLFLPVAMFFAADMLNDILKDIFARQRPCQALEGVRLLVRCPRSSSLPSGHAIDSFAFSVSFFILAKGLVSRGWRWYALVLAAMIAFSRVYIGVHYPSDIVLGTLLGMAIAWAACAPLSKLLESRIGGRRT